MTIKTTDLKELEDHSWFPPGLRNFQTEFIGFVVARLNVYSAFVQYLRSLSLRPQPVTDLCSGSGEPAVSVFQKSDCFTQLVLSDKYPNPLPVHDKRICYETKPADVLEMEFSAGRYYTMFNALHHFEDVDKLKIVSKLKTSGAGAFFVEILEPRPSCFVKVLFATTIGNVLLTPFIRPFSLKRLLLLPVNIVTIAFDGIVSVFKSRSAARYKKLFGKTAEVARLKNGWSPLIVIRIPAAA